MYLEKFTIENFRKFKDKNNEIIFANNVNGKNLNGSTLIIGQNNVGKTSIIAALKRSTNCELFSATDFNFSYLSEILEYFYINLAKIKSTFIDGEDKFRDERENLISGLSPFMKFGFTFVLNCTDSDCEELLTNIAPLITNDLIETREIRAFVKFGVKEEIKFITNFYDKFKNKNKDDAFAEFVEFLENDVEFENNIYLDEACESAVSNFSIKDLVKVNVVSFEKLHASGRLSSAFNKIYSYKVSHDKNSKTKISEQIKEINKKIDEDVTLSKELTTKVNDAVNKAFDSDHISMELKANLTIDSLLRNVIKYQYKDGSYDVPEDQFGMGYTNLMLIIAELIDYIDDSPKSIFNNTINLIIIEEPESYMHPQMQKLLIKNLNDVVENLIDSGDKKLNCQLIITSHSPNILYGKLEVEDSFNNIDYINLGTGNCSKIRCLQDFGLMPELTNEPNSKLIREQEFKFLKRRIKYNFCDLFFADAGLVIEGFSEEILLPYFLNNHKMLAKKYITIINVNGAYAHIYKNLFKAIDIPISIITDIDIQGTHNSEQVSSLTGKETTNSVLKAFDFIIGQDFVKRDNNISVFTQTETNGFYPTSFEEALILSNANNSILKVALEKTMSNTYKSKKDDILNNSHFLQVELDKYSRKGEFSTNLLFSLVNKKEDELFELPKYISDAFDFLSKNLLKSGGEEHE